MFYVDKARCTGCGTCIQVCSQGAISIMEDKAFISQWLCIECGSCLAACPVEAIGEIEQPAGVPCRAASNALPSSRMNDFRRGGVFNTPVSKGRTTSGIIYGLERKIPFLGRYRGAISGTRIGRGTGRCYRKRGRFAER